MAAGRYNHSRKGRHYRKESHHCEKLSSRDSDHRGLEHNVITHESSLNTGSSGGCNHVIRRSLCGPGDAFDFEEEVGDKGITKFEDGAQMPPEKKRKFSPIVWNRDQKQVKILSKNRLVPTSSLCSSSSVPKTVGQLPTVILNGRIKRYSVAADQIQGLQTSSVGLPVETGSAEIGLLEYLTELTVSISPEQYRKSDQELEKLEEEEYIVKRNISTSKWAYVDTDTNIASPESGEFWREGSEESREKSSGSSKSGHFMGPAGGDELSRNDLDIEGVKENDEKYDKFAGVSPLDSSYEDDDDFCRIQVPTLPKHRKINMLQGCRSVYEYQKLNKINEGTYGVVFRAKDRKMGEIVALKKVKMGKETEGFPVPSLREINILMSLQHPSIVEVKEVVMDDLDDVYMVMEYMEHDLRWVMEVMKQPFSQSEVKCLMLQLLEGVNYLFDNWVLHRDLKTSNLLLNNRGELKICDFGLSRQYGSPLKAYSPLVETLWYRAPELLLGTKRYSTTVDMWSVGCIMAELLAKKPLFDGKTEIEQLDKIFRTLGTPNEMIWPGFSNLPGVEVNFVKQPYNLLREKFPAVNFRGSPVLTELGFDLLKRLLTYDPEKRITAEAALNHGWFREAPLPISKEFMPTFPAQHA